MSIKINNTMLKMEKGQVLVKNVLVISDDKHIKLYFFASYEANNN